MLVIAASGITVAVAAGTAKEGSDFAYVGAGVQYGRWSQSDKTVRLHSSPANNMSSNRCMDVMVDWRIDQPFIGRQHYDARVVRSCKPGVDEETDPGGDREWSEPSDWEGETPHGLQRGFGLIISDSSLDVIARERFEDAGMVDAPQTQPSTFGQGATRVRTRYNNGNVGSCNPLPADSAEDHGCS